jgi:hypothetical protein
MDISLVTFYSVPVANVQRYVSFTIHKPYTSLEELSIQWNDPSHGHVITMTVHNDSMWLGNQSNEDMILYAFNMSSQKGYCIGSWNPCEFKEVSEDALYNGSNMMIDTYIAFSDIQAFSITAYLHRKKAGLHYSRKDVISLPAGVYFGLGAVAASLNDSIQMRGERNGYIYHFISRKGKICIESSHRQPDPSFLEIVPLTHSMGLTEDTTLRLRTKERVDFEYNVCSIISYM